ncbi:MAG TPA: hypothetical protein VLI92_02225 [Candidatus Saccharimonadales bacterium]|nr:hypothetical protein [Candidatus Saccharimonadales bacterium]
MKYFQLVLLILILASLLAISFFLYKIVQNKPVMDNNVVLESSPTPVATVVVTPTIPTLTPSVTPTSAQKAGNVSGKICYPGEGIPPLKIYLQNTTTNAVLVQSTSQNQNSYSFSNVIPGTYYAFAYVKGGNLGGDYSPAVPCGLSVNCTDHKPIAVNVVSGSSLTNIDICDWYGQPSDVPAQPQQ